MLQAGKTEPQDDFEASVVSWVAAGVATAAAAAGASSCTVNCETALAYDPGIARPTDPTMALGTQAGATERYRRYVVSWAVYSRVQHSTVNG